MNDEMASQLANKIWTRTTIVFLSCAVLGTVVPWSISIFAKEQIPLLVEALLARKLDWFWANVKYDIGTLLSAGSSIESAELYWLQIVFTVHLLLAAILFRFVFRCGGHVATLLQMHRADPSRHWEALFSFLIIAILVLYWLTFALTSTPPFRGGFEWVGYPVAAIFYPLIVWELFWILIQGLLIEMLLNAILAGTILLSEARLRK